MIWLKQVARSAEFLRRIVTSPEWRTIQRASKDIRYLPNRLMREAGLEEEINKMKELSSQDDIKGLRNELEEWRRDVSAWTTPPPTIETPRERLNPREPKTEQINFSRRCGRGSAKYGMGLRITRRQTRNIQKPNNDALYHPFHLVAAHCPFPLDRQYLECRAR